MQTGSGRSRTGWTRRSARRTAPSRRRPPGEIRNFFGELNYRDPIVLRPHLHHWIELAAMVEVSHTSPVRDTPLLYNLWDARSEGLATGMEEMTMHAGLLDGRPRSRELVWVMLAQRAARALSGLHSHGNVFDMEEAVGHATGRTPRGWIPDAALSCLTGTTRIEEPYGRVGHPGGCRTYRQALFRCLLSGGGDRGRADAPGDDGKAPRGAECGPPRVGGVARLAPNCHLGVVLRCE